MSNQTKQRDYLFDNYKAFLILLVVIGHFTLHTQMVDFLVPHAGIYFYFRLLF